MLMDRDRSMLMAGMQIANRMASQSFWFVEDVHEVLDIDSGSLPRYPRSPPGRQPAAGGVSTASEGHLSVATT